MEYFVYGMIDPESKKIVYIDWMSGDGGHHEDYPTGNDYLYYTLDNINTNDEYDNPYWSDLNRLYKGEVPEVAVLDHVYDDEETIQGLTEEYIKIIKPKYNNWGYNSKFFNEQWKNNNK